MKIKVLKAVYYERVSTANESQESSLENQRKLCEKYLMQHPEVVLVEPIDSYCETVSGKSDVRKCFTAMLTRIAKGDVDLLLVKDLKRLARSTEISAQLRSLCKRYDFKLVLLETGAIYDPNEEGNRMLYGFESLLNEEVVYRQSAYGRIAHQQKMDEKRLNRQNVTYGYSWDYDKKDMIINEEEAEIVRYIFDMFVFENLGTSEIRRYLSKKGVSISVATVIHRIEETAYIGIFNMNKRTSILEVGAGAKSKRIKNSKTEWVKVERLDLAIVDKEVFQLAQNMLQYRRTTFNGHQQGRFIGKHLFAGKVFCGECGYSYSHYYTNRKKTESRYSDTRGIRSRVETSEGCANIEYSKVSEELLKEVVLAAINGFMSEHKLMFNELRQAIKKTIQNGSCNDSGKQKWKKEMKGLKEKADKIFDTIMISEGQLKVRLVNEYGKIQDQIEELERKIVTVADGVTWEEKCEHRIKEIEKHLVEIQQIEEINRYLIEVFVKKIVIYKNGEIIVYLKTDSFYKTYITNCGSNLLNQETLEKKAPDSRKNWIQSSKYGINWHANVSEMFNQCTTGRFRLLMQILFQICCHGWKL